MTLVVETKGDGPPLMLLHGWAFGSRIWDSVIDELADSFRVLRVELPGYPLNPTSDRNTFGEIVDDLVMNLAQETHVIGWSLGGMLTLGVAKDAPDKIGKIILVSTNLRFTSCEGWPHAMQPETLRKFRENLSDDTESTLHRFGALVARGSVANSAEVRYFRQQLRESGAPEVSALEEGLAILGNLDLRSAEMSTDSQALFVFGENDALVPASVAADVQKIMPDARTVVFETAGHAPFLAHKQKFIDTVKDFLA